MLTFLSNRRRSWRSIVERNGKNESARRGQMRGKKRTLIQKWQPWWDLVVSEQREKHSNTQYTISCTLYCILCIHTATVKSWYNITIDYGGWYKYDIASHEYVGVIKEHGIKVTLPFLVSTAKHSAMKVKTVWCLIVQCQLCQKISQVCCRFKYSRKSHPNVKSSLIQKKPLPPQIITMQKGTPLCIQIVVVYLSKHFSFTSSS